MPWITAWQGVSRVGVVSGDRAVSAAVADRMVLLLGSAEPNEKIVGAETREWRERAG